MTKEELLALCEEWKQMSGVDEKNSLAEDASEAMISEGEKSESKQAQNVNAEEYLTEENVAQNTEILEETVDGKKNVLTEGEMETAEAEITETVEMTTSKTESFSQGSDQSFAGNSQNNGANAGFAATNQQMIQNGEFVVPQENLQPYTQVNVADLIDQVARNVRVHISSQMTSMEMQLNPEHLGKLYLQVSESEGVIRAQITAQNEVVKEALETQLVELRQTLHQQGVRVEAIEVTVATHEFEQNLEGNAKQEEQLQDQMEEAKKQTRRNINMNELDGLTGLMSEEEALVAKIMKDNGNQVDLTA